ncbi:recombinase family protein [Skermanella pratensis]|uniref:recombinase family protein n=1 Tax=Skermanella pratensis TaxID=2233999 RepID=UPI001B3BCFC8|nr:recombinase family protein [Skermanella pratensis]
MSLAIPLSDKVTGRHRDRTAVVYLRQSTPQQVGRHPESTRLQYGLVDRALQLGWARERIMVIDEDLGRSGGSADRPGFQRLVAEVSLDGLAWCSASRCPGWPAPAVTGTSCSKSAPWREP